MREFKIYYDRTQAAALKSLSGDKELPLFQNQAEALCFCSNYGFENNKKKKVPKDNAVEVASSAVEKYSEHIYSIALLEKKDATILGDTSECCKIFQEYANGGLHAISKILERNRPNDPKGVETLLGIIIKMRSKLSDLPDEDLEVLLPESD